MAKHKYQKGNSHGRGGKRPNAGRPKNIVKATAKEMATDRVDQALKVVDDILAGRIGGPKERLAAAELMLAYAWHKPTQPTQMEAEVTYQKVFGPDMPEV